MNDLEKARLYISRFVARSDVYGVKWFSKRADGTPVSGFAPKCQKLWSDGCHLKTKSGTRCDSCEIKQYDPVTEDTVLQHLRGENEQIQYSLAPSGTCKYGAFDWDYKEGKEARGFRFDTVKRASDVLRAWGLHPMNCRSTGGGHHTYFFVTVPYPANKMRAILLEVFERCGVLEGYRLGAHLLPETFPKQSYVSTSGLGNGIKTPLISSESSGIGIGRNCVVDDTGEMLGAGLPLAEATALQWKAFAELPLSTPEELDQLIEREKIPVYEDTPTARGPSPGGAYLGGHLQGGQRGNWQPALNGSFEKVMEGCAAFRRVWERCAVGTVPPHAEGFAMFFIAKSTNDGMKLFSERVPGWGKSEADLKQLQHSLDKNYSPPTCRKMQENGICKAGTVCFRKKPPVETVEGQLVVRDDLPESQWPEPSPIRYAFGSGDDFLRKLIDEVVRLRDTQDHDQLVEKLKAVAYRAQVFDEDQQKELRAFIKNLRNSANDKVIRAGEISKIFNEAAERSNDELKQDLAKSKDVVMIDGIQYRKLHPFGYGILKAARSKSTTTPLCTVDITVQEIRGYLDDDKMVQRVYLGKCYAPKMEVAFEIDAKSWRDNTKFLEYFEVLLGDKFNVLRQNTCAIRQAAMAFSQHLGINRSNLLTTQGWSQDSYLMPSAVVDREGVKPNTEQKVDLSHKDFARGLDFRLLSDEELRETLLHIKVDLLNSWPRFWTTLGMAHAMVPALLKPLNIRQKPALFYEGLTGAGKTELTHMLQHFWGDFPLLLNMTSTSKGVLAMAYEFRDALLVLDDFKGLDERQKHDIKQVLQYAYDGSASTKLKRDSSFHPSKYSRAIIMASGEQFVTAEASVVARTILIEVDKHDTRTTRAGFQRCEAMRKNYSGVTARFIQWFLTNDRQELRELFHKARSAIQEKIADRQNGARIAFNLAVNHIAWDLFVDFMLHSSVISHQEKEELLNEHHGYLYNLARDIADRCEEEQGGVIFTRLLRQLIDTGEVSIRHLDGCEREKKPIIGYAPKGDQVGAVVYLHPEVTWKAVQDYSRNIAVGGTIRSIGRQMVELGIICEHDRGHSTKQIRGDGGSRRRVWIVDIGKLGFETRHLRVVNSTEPLPLRPGTPELTADDEGIF